MKRTSLRGRALAGLLMCALCLAAVPTDMVSAASLGVTKPDRRQPTAMRTVDDSWTSLSIDRRPRGYNRAEHWYGPSGWRAIVSFEYASPFDADNSPLTSGTGAELALVTPSPQGLGLRLAFGWSGIDVDDDHDIAAPLPPEYQIDYRKRSMDVYRAFLSLQYRTLPPQNVRNATEFTIYGGLGFVIHEMDAEMTLYDSNTDRVSHYSSGETTTKPAMTLGCAGSIMFTPQIGVEASLSTDILLGEEPGYTTDGMYGFDAMTDYDGSWAMRLGLVFAF